MIIPIFLTITGAFILTTIMTYTYFPPTDPTSEPPPINPFEEPSDPSSDPIGTAGAAFGNAILYVAIALIGGLIFVYFIKKGMIRILELAFAAVMGFSSLFFIYLLLPAVLFQLLNNFSFLIPPFEFITYELIDLVGITIAPENILPTYGLVFGFLFALLNFAVLGLQRFQNEKLHNSLMILFGMGMGSIFGAFFDTISLVAVLLALALYDIYAVFYGPLKEMFETLGVNSEDGTEGMKASNTYETLDSNLSDNNNGQDLSMNAQPQSNKVITENETIGQSEERRLVLEPRFRTISLPVYTTPSISIGLGDFVFFSVLIAKATFLAISGGFLWLANTEGLKIYYSFLILPFVGIIIGSYITFRLLEHREILPALPIPLFFGIIGFLISLVLQI